MERSAGTLLGGRVRYEQPRQGHRTGIEPVLLAAAVPARAGQRVLEAGTGAGAGLLCLLARVPGVLASGIELDPAMAAVARDNIAANGFAADIRTMDVTAAATLGRFDHAFANPPWHDPAGTAPAHPGRLLARHRAATGLDAWIVPLAASLNATGALTLILPAKLVESAAARMQAEGLGTVEVLPLLPKAGRAAKLVIVAGRREAAGVTTLPGQVLHDPGGTYTTATQAILREGGAITW